MSGAGCHIKGSRNNQHFNTLIRHGTDKFRKADIITDTKPHLSKFRIKYSSLIAGTQGIRLFKILTAFDVDVKKMNLAVFCDLMTVSIKADKETKMGIIADIKQELRRAYALKISYAATQRTSY